MNATLNSLILIPEISEYLKKMERYSHKKLGNLETCPRRVTSLRTLILMLVYNLCVEKRVIKDSNVNWIKEIAGYAKSILIKKNERQEKIKELNGSVFDKFFATSGYKSYKALPLQRNIDFMEYKTTFKSLSMPFILYIIAPKSV